jgi:hypothetical protein
VRGDMSSTLPIGVATTYSFPAMGLYERRASFSQE